MFRCCRPFFLGTPNDERNRHAIGTCLREEVVKEVVKGGKVEGGGVEGGGVEK